MSIPPAQIQYQLEHIKEDRSGQLVGVTVFLVVITTVSTVLRLLCRKVVQKLELNAADYWMIVSLILAYAMCAMNFLGVHYGFGKHLILTTEEERISIIKTFYAFPILYCATVAAVKISMLLFYSHLFPTRSFRIARNIVGAIVIVVWIGSTLANGLSCIPLRALWDFSITDAKCINLLALYKAGSVNIVTDVLIVILPIRSLWKVQISKAQKISISFIFMLGGLVTVAGVVRVFELLKYTIYDGTYTNVGSCIWSTTEPCVGIVCGNLLLLRPLIARFEGSYSSIRTRMGGSRFGTAAGNSTIDKTMDRGGRLYNEHNLQHVPPRTAPQRHEDPFSRILHSSHHQSVLDLEANRLASTVPKRYNVKTIVTAKSGSWSGSDGSLEKGR